MTTAKEVEELIRPLNGKKPRLVFVEATVRDMLEDSDALSGNFCVFVNGGFGGGGRAVPFVELTPELLKYLRKEWA